MKWSYATGFSQDNNFNDLPTYRIGQQLKKKNP